MKKIKVLIITAIVICAAVGIFAIAADYGTQNDPLVSLSYITDVFMPDLLSRAEKLVTDTAKTVNNNISAYESRVDKKTNEFIDRNTAAVDNTMIDRIANKVTQPDSKQTAPFTTLNLTSGKTLVLSKGCEVLVTSGSVSCKSGSLTDMTTGGLVSSGGSVSVNHLCVSSASVTLSIKSNSAILVKGQYSAY